MHKSYIYPKLILLVTFLALGLSSAHAQLEFKLQLMDDTTWGVYVRPDTTITPTDSTEVGAGQVTLVAPNGFTYSGFTNVKGIWIENARVNAPPENPSRDYISFGFISNVPKITVQAGSETLLFKFNRVGSCPDSLYLIENGVDPFDQLPNSANSNPGNNLDMYDFLNAQFYTYARNYAPSAWSCHDCDGDGILNGIEDTNGDGSWTVGVDTSNLCDPCDPIHVETATLDYLGGYNTICAGDVGDTAYLVVTIEGGWVPYTVIYTDGTNVDTVSNFHSGDSIAVVPTTSLNYTLSTVIDSFNCVINPDSIVGNIPIIVEGPISFTADPVDVTECSGNATSFSVSATNAGAGTLYYNWQVNSGSGWVDITNGTPYSTATTNTLVISDVAGLHGNQYRAKIFTDVCDTVYSAAATLQVEGPISVTANPSDSQICDGGNTTFTASAVNAGAVGTLYYQWQVNTGSGWVDLSNSAPYSGVSSTTLTLTGATVALDSNLYRMKIFTGQCDTIYTNSAMLDIEGPLTVTDHPDDVSNCAGNEVFFSLAFTNGGGPLSDVSIQWQENTDSGWVNLNDAAPYNGVQTDTLAITNVIGLDGAQYRAYISTGTCSAVYSNAATLNVNGNASFSDHPDDITVCSGNDTMFVAAASIPQGTFTYNWQVSFDNGVTWVNLSDTLTVDSVAPTGDTLFISDVAGMYNYRFRVQALSSSCDPVNSDEARLTVEGPISVNTHPADQSICAGEPVLVTAAFDNPGGTTIYRWQVSTNGGSSWSDLSNTNGYNGTATPNLSIATTTGKDGNQYRLSARTGTCNILYTNPMTLTVEGPLTVTTHPTPVTTCSGEAVTFSAAVSNAGAGTMSYVWQENDGSGWSNLSDAGVYSGTTTTTLSISDVSGLYGRCYRMRTTTSECTEVFTNEACLTVEGPLAIVDEPDTVYQCSGEPVYFIVGVTNGSTDDPNTYYQWQESSNNGATWTNLTNTAIYNGVGTDTLSIANTSDKDNNLYRVLTWTGTCDTLTSAVAQLLIEGPITVTDEPDNITECSGSGVTFQATIANAGLGTLYYRWERSCDDGITWDTLSDSGVYSGTATTTLVISDVAGLDSCRFRLRYNTDNCVNDHTNYAVLTVEGPISIDVLGQPQSVTACSDETVNFGVTALNTGSGQITYQWQTKSGSNWVNLSNNSIYNGVTSSNLSVVASGLNNTCYRVLIQTANCSSIASDSACLTVEGPISFTDHPDDITQCSGESVIFVGSAGVAAGTSGTISYQWQISSDGLNWSNIPNGAPYSGVTNDTLTITNVAGLNGQRYRLTARTAECNPVESDPARLTVEGPLTVTSNPSDWSTCSDKEAFFAAKVSNPGEGYVEYQWLVSTDGGSTWGLINNDSIYNGSKTDTLSISPVAGKGGYMYKLQAWTGTCDTVETAAATLSVEGPLEFTDEPDDITVCAGDPASFTVAIDNPGLGSVSYQWQRSTNGGQTWSNLTNTSPYSGVTTNTLSISNTTGLYNNKFRCRIRTANCEWVASTNATLFVEGPITIDVQPVDATVCSNIGHQFTSTISNPGAGVLSLQWQVSSNGGSTWANVSNGAIGNGGVYQGATTDDLNISLVESLDGYQYRLVISTSQCNDTTDIVTLTVNDACTTGTCDLDLDGTINDLDADDDNDQLTDYWEDWMTVHNTLDGWYYTDSNGDTLSYDRCLTDSDGDGVLDNQEDPDGDNINNGEETDGDLVFDGNPLDPCDPVLGPTCIGINVSIKVRLQGAFLTAPGQSLMQDHLREKAYIPASEPYENMQYFTHYGDGGGEVVSDSATIFGATGNNAIVDWVFVELRSSFDLDSIYHTRSALLTADGHVVDMDGDTVLHFPTANAGSFFVVVRHRNHLGIMTAEALELSPIVQEIDFTDPSFPTNGLYAQVTQSGAPAMWAGDLNSDGRSIYQGPGNDVYKIFATIVSDPDNTNQIANFISQGYLTADIDLDGRAIFQGPGNDRSKVLFNVILAYPANGSNLANYVILEQLP
ncbi:MAG: hypothetical protein CMN32_17125 [Saprospirales bacterium]|nr:hypothetical protein [Saprospirales bacterium]